MVANLNNPSNIVIFGAGYVGMSLAVLLSQTNQVQVIDTDVSKITKINNKETTVKDSLIQEYLSEKKLFLTASLPSREIFQTSQIYIIATPTDYDEENNAFDTSSVEQVIEDILNNNNDPEALIIIKSTVPVGFTESLNRKYQTNRIIFSPEFLREGSALQDSLFPSRVIVGGVHPNKEIVADILINASLKKNAPIMLMDSSSAEAVKLFSNTFLAMRVSFFNELDSFAIEKKLDPLMMINGVCADPRIGDFYNNPSFGYGGYCLPKDSKQLLANYSDVPQNLMQAVVDANLTRQKYIANLIIQGGFSVVGIYKLSMKEGSDNYRFSSILGITKLLIESSLKVIIYEPDIHETSFQGADICNDLDRFMDQSNIILANRNNPALDKVQAKVFTRDLFNNN